MNLRTTDELELAARVLVVEDERLTASILADAVAAYGFECTCAHSVAEAREILRERGHGVALVDIHLPDGTGLDFIRECAAAYPYMRAIVMSARTTQAAAVEALRVGAVDFLQKPIDDELLGEKLRLAASSHATALERDNLLARYRTLFETIPGVAWFVTNDGTFKQMNAAGAEMLGFEPDHFVGRPFQELLSDSERPENVQWVFRERRTGARATQRRIVSLRTADSCDRLFELSTTGYYARDSQGGHKHLGTIGVGWDATERLRLQEQLRHSQKMEAVGRLAGGVAHDFNNMLTVINANAQLVRHQLGPGHELGPVIRDIEDAGQRAADLTRRLLTFSRRSLVLSKPVSIAGIVRGVLRMLERVLGETLTIELQLDAAPDVVMADASQLEQVLVNLAVNARDAMPDGGTLLIRSSNRLLLHGSPHISPDLALGEYVVLEVIDNGAGMGPDVREHIFEPFFTTKGPHTGTGLGLSIVYGIVQQHCGAVEVTSVVDKGTTMRVYLPRALEPEERRGAPTSETVFDRGGETVLVVEDEGMVRRLLLRSLKFQNYQVLEAEEGESALAILRERAAAGDPVQLLVTDMVMPGLTGAELARQARQEHSQLRVLYMSGYIGEAVSSEDLLQSGASFLEKPVTAARFLGKVREILDEEWELPTGAG